MAIQENKTSRDSGLGEMLKTRHGVPVLERTGLRRIGVIQDRAKALDDVAAEAFRRVVQAYGAKRYTDDRASVQARSSSKRARAADRESARQGPAVEAAEYIQARGLTDEIDEVTDRLSHAGVSEVTRLLLGNEDVYGSLILNALKKEAIDHDDVTGIVESILRNVEEEPRSFFEGALVQAVFKRNHITIPADEDTPASGQYKRILERVREEGITLRSGIAEQRILALQKQIAADGDLPSFIDTWARAQHFTTNGESLSPQIRSTMVETLKRLNVPFTLSGVQKGRFNQYFAIAYDQAARTGAMATSDPISLTRSQGTFSAWDFKVDSFDAAEEQGVIPENIRAAGALDYVYFLGDMLGVYKITDALVLRWAAGVLDIQDVDTSSRLYRYWQLRDGRLSEEERGMLYKRVLSKGDTQLLSRMVVNEAFPGQWHALMGSVADFIRDSTDAAREGAVSRIPIYRATQSLQYNLSEYMTGMAPMQVTDMYMQLTDALDILGAPEIVSQLSSGRRRGVWAVIDRLGKEELHQSIDVGTVRTLAVQGNKVFQWIADFDQGTVTDSQFDEFREAAEAWIIAASGAEAAAQPQEPLDEEEEGSKGEFDVEGNLEANEPDVGW